MIREHFPNCSTPAFWQHQVNDRSENVKFMRPLVADSQHLPALQRLRNLLPR